MKGTLVDLLLEFPLKYNSEDIISNLALPHI